MKLLNSFHFSFRKVSRAMAVCMATGMVPTTAPAAAPVVGLWRFNEGSGINAADSSGLNNNGTLIGENGNVPSWATGQAGFGSALRFTNDTLNHAYVDVPGSSSLKIGQTASDAWSICAWAYEDSGGTGNFVDYYGRMVVLDNGYAFQLESGAVGDDQMYTWSRLPSGAWQIGWGAFPTVAPLLDQWVHWAVVYDGTNLTVYRNGDQGTYGGTAATAVTAALGFAGYAGAVRIGDELGQTGNTRTWNGLLDDVAIFAGALTEAEVGTIMTGDFSAHLGGPAKLLTQPQNQTVSPGPTVTLSVTAQGVQPLQYQWYFNSTNRLAQGTNASLVLTNVQVADAGLYSVTVSNSLGVDQSQPAVLIVNTNPIFLVGLWRFNDGAGSRVTDSSGFGHDGTLSGEGGNLPAWVTGQTGLGGALWFTNDNANHTYVDVPASSSLQVGQTATNPWSMTAWAYEDSGGTAGFVATYGRIMVIDDGDAFQLESGAVGDGQMYTWSRQNVPWQQPWGDSSPVAPLLDQWVHWAVVYDGTNLTLYRNGNQGAQGGMSTTNVTAALGYNGYGGAVRIGTELGQAANRNWNGMLDDVAVFNLALSQAQVRTVMSGDFNAFITRPPLSIQVGPTNAVLSWSALLPGFKPQFSPSLAAPQWQAIPQQPVVQGTVVVVNVPLPTGTTSQFFRLASP